MENTATATIDDPDFREVYDATSKVQCPGCGDTFDEEVDDFTFSYTLDEWVCMQCGRDGDLP
jgi:DNA-directed RNA polymerase subunit RPC12/RpoP